MMLLGIDIGSVISKAVLLDESFHVKDRWWNISAQIKRDYGKIPIPTLVYCGTDGPSENTKLEAFVYQVQRFAQKKRIIV